MEIEEYWKQVCRLNEQINHKLVQAARLRREGRTVEWAAMEREIDRDIDALVDLKERFHRSRPGEEATV